MADATDTRELNDFASDALRRVAGTFTHPRTVTAAQRALDEDPWAYELVPVKGEVHPRKVQLGIANRDLVQKLVDELVADGVLKKLGDLRTPKALIDACKDDDDVIDLHRDKAKILRDRASHHRARHRLYLDPGDNYVLTRKGLAKLLGSVPDEPPPQPLEDATETLYPTPPGAPEPEQPEEDS